MAAPYFLQPGWRLASRCSFGAREAAPPRPMWSTASRWDQVNKAGRWLRSWISRRISGDWKLVRKIGGDSWRFTRTIRRRHGEFLYAATKDKQARPG